MVSSEYLPFYSHVISFKTPHESDHAMPMEYLPLNDGSGQGYGYVMYRTTIPSTSKKVTVTSLNDYGVVCRCLTVIVNKHPYTHTH